MKFKNKRIIVALFLVAYILLITFTCVFIRIQMDKLAATLMTAEVTEELIFEPVVLAIEEVPENVPEELTEAVETIPEEPEHAYFDIPLDKELQDHIMKVCEANNVDSHIVMAVIERESRFKVDAVGDSGNSLGLMQIQPRWHQARMEKLGVTDLLDPYQNVVVGIDLLAELQGICGYSEYNDRMAWILMSYNGGCSYANKKLANGEYSEYVYAVMDRSERLLSDYLTYGYY